MEAEAQCAVLDIAGLTNGSITDDSDILLFGGKRVYKNIFNQEKYAELYTTEDINHTLCKYIHVYRVSSINSTGSLYASDRLHVNNYTIGWSVLGPFLLTRIFVKSNLHIFSTHKNTRKS